VDIIRFIIKDSIEERILELQKRKAALADLTFSEKLSKQEILKRRLEDLRCLFRGSSELMRKGPSKLPGVEANIESTAHTQTNASSH